MKMLFFTLVIVGIIWYLMRTRFAPGNDLTAHLLEQDALKSIGSTATNANQIGNENFPLATLGQTPLAGLRLDPLNPDNPFSVPFETDFNMPTPSLAGITATNQP